MENIVNYNPPTKNNVPENITPAIENEKASTKNDEEASNKSILSSNSTEEIK